MDLSLGRKAAWLYLPTQASITSVCRRTHSIRMNALRWITSSLLTAAAVIALVIVFARMTPEGRAWLATLPHSFHAPDSVPTTDEAERALQSGDTGLARAMVQQALASGLTDAQSDYDWGNIAQGAGDDASAVLAYARGEAAYPEFVWNFVALGQLSARLGRLDPALMQLRHAVALAPTMQFLHYDLGSVELAQHHYGDAARDFETEIALTPDYQPAIAGKRKAVAALKRSMRLANRSRQQAGSLPTPQITSSATQPSVALVLPAPTPAASAIVRAPPPSSGKVRQRIAVVPLRLLDRGAPEPHAAGAPGAVAATPEPTEPPRPTPAPTQTPLPVAVMAEAREYLIGVSRDLGFTHALPAGDPSISSAELARRLNALQRVRGTNVDGMLQIGASALLSGRLALAEAAFNAASAKNQTDWRGPYLAGLAAQAAGDVQLARTDFIASNTRLERPETETSLAIVELELGDPARGRTLADRAAALDPSYEPGRFTAGMLALINGDPPQATQHLSAAWNLGGAPARLAYFLDVVKSGRSAGD